jgi:BirA family biotin operon repressor/biotin-[acetyl-CoA-carboxylase] ligase
MELNVGMLRIHFDSTDSTNDQARRLAAEHPGEVLLVTAAEQTAGRGRRGRTWHSPRGGAWLTLVRPLTKPPAAYAGASLAAALGVYRAILRVLPEVETRLRVKWPNDLLLDGLKIAGILCEQFPAAAGAPPVVVIGVGVNVDLNLDAFAGELRHPATTLSMAVRRAVAVDNCVDSLATELDAVLTAFEATGLDEAMLTALRTRLADVGEVRTLNSANGSLTGRVVGLDDAGRLLLEGPAGMVAYNVGELAPQVPGASSWATRHDQNAVADRSDCAASGRLPAGAPSAASEDRGQPPATPAAS